MRPPPLPPAPHGAGSTGPVLHRTIAGLRDAVAEARAEWSAAPVVLVPTMGALHAGHLAHVHRGLELGGIVVVSIFVNPLQFGRGEDLDRYPRDLDADLVALTDAGAHMAFVPSAGEMYPGAGPLVTLRAGGAAAVFEGASRPGHFDGMLTVVMKLLNIVRPDIVTFGQKDAQQLFLVRRMIADLDMPVRIETIPIVREPDGLAVSSRNRYLDRDERESALALSKSLTAARDAADSGSRAVMDAAHGILEAARAAPVPVRLDYLDIVDPATFESTAVGHRGEALVVVAARVGETRLIDNETIVLGPAPAAP